MPHARLAQAADLASLLDLFRVSEVSSSAEPIERAEQIWLEMLSCDGVAVFVSTVDAQIAATCMLRAQSAARRTAARLSRERRHPSRFSRPGPWTRRGWRCARRGLVQGLLPRPHAERPARPARASLLSTLRLRAGSAGRLRRAPSGLKRAVAAYRVGIAGRPGCHFVAAQIIGSRGTYPFPPLSNRRPLLRRVPMQGNGWNIPYGADQTAYLVVDRQGRPEQERALLRSRDRGSRP